MMLQRIDSQHYEHRISNHLIFKFAKARSPGVVKGFLCQLHLSSCIAEGLDLNNWIKRPQLLVAKI